MNKESSIKSLYTQKITKEELKDIKDEISQNASAVAFNSALIQNNLLNPEDSFLRNYQDFQSFLTDVGYKGKAIAELSQDEAAQLVSADGIFGISQTSQRIANFVINGAGSDESRLRAGREGMIQGFKEAEAMWGGKLPEISQQTMLNAIEMVDKAISDLGYSILNEKA
ncbi:MAG: hypothetical protein COB17_07890 [Sulfurimonas sp.]|nr:MAG: hypothetical protein COB17_07890 [Sulfurimonas sp.]